MGRVLAVDLGSKRVGLALSDLTRTIAQPLGAMAAEPASSLVRRLSERARQEGCDEVVIGLPRRLDGGFGPEAHAARTTADELRRSAGLRVHLVDERLTSVQAERSLIEQGVSRRRRRTLSDPVAATLILQGFLGAIDRG